ncbi:MAG TPA: BAX inhibitor (BI)-1/YccA family protein, partial [Enterococcus sp.]|nr:BAX inhibitor (BI)-1/YccA family protein [Enterococcus sp.]
MNNHQVIEDTSGLNKFYAKVYGIFGLGLGISALAAFLCSSIFLDQTLTFIQNFPLGLTGIWIAE